MPLQAAPGLARPRAAPLRARGAAARASRASPGRRGRVAATPRPRRAPGARGRAGTCSTRPCAPPGPEVPRTAASDETRQTRSPVPVLGGQPLEQRVGVRRVPDRERPDLDLLADAVEDDDPARPVHGDEAGELVGQLAHVGASARVEQVVAVEEVERGLGHDAMVGQVHPARQRAGRARPTPAAGAPRTAAPPRRR